MTYLKNSKTGFTLIEMVLAIALAAVIVVASSSVLLSITQIWIKEENIDDFQDHVNGVEKFLQNHFKQNFFFDNDLIKPRWAWAPNANKRADPQSLSFSIKTPNPLLSPVKPGLARCYLSFIPNEGLFLVYHSFYKTVSGLDKEPVYRRRLSPWANTIEYFYYNQDTNQWRDEPPPSSADLKSPPLPDFIKITFLKEGISDTIWLPFKRDDNGTPLVL